MRRIILLATILEQCNGLMAQDPILSNLAVVVDHLQHPSTYRLSQLKCRVNLQDLVASASEPSALNGLHIASVARIKREVEAAIREGQRVPSAFDLAGLGLLAEQWRFVERLPPDSRWADSTTDIFVIDTPRMAAYSYYNAFGLPDIVRIDVIGAHMTYHPRERALYVEPPANRDGYSIFALAGFPMLVHEQALWKLAHYDNKEHVIHLDVAGAVPGTPAIAINMDGPLPTSTCITDLKRCWEVRTVRYLPNKSDDPQIFLRQVALVQVLGTQLTISLSTVYDYTPIVGHGQRIPVERGTRVYDGAGDDAKVLGRLSEASAANPRERYVSALLADMISITSSPVTLWGGRQ